MSQDQTPVVDRLPTRVIDVGGVADIPISPTPPPTDHARKVAEDLREVASRLGMISAYSRANLPEDRHRVLYFRLDAA